MCAIQLVQPIVGRGEPKVPVPILEDVYKPPHIRLAPGRWIKRIAGQFVGSSIVDRQTSSDGGVTHHHPGRFSAGSNVVDVVECSGSPMP